MINTEKILNQRALAIENLKKEKHQTFSSSFFFLRLFVNIFVIILTSAAVSDYNLI